jgi:nitrite reductase/ring-hydroxylating ferredoxin subunit
MKIVVVGASGLIGAKLVATLTRAGHEGPLHVAQFNVSTGAVLRGGQGSAQTYRVTVDGEIGRVEVPLAHAIQGA